MIHCIVARQAIDFLAGKVRIWGMHMRKLFAMATIASCELNHFGSASLAILDGFDGVRRRKFTRWGSPMVVVRISVSPRQLR